MANWFAYIMFFSWPIVIIVLVNKFSLKHAVLWATVGSYLLLPARLNIDLPFLPPLMRDSITFLPLFIYLKVVGVNFHVFQRGMFRNLLIIYFLVLVVSVELNKFAIPTGGGRVLKALSHYDALSSIIRYFCWFIPFLIGRRCFNSFDDNERIFGFLTKAALLYSILMLFEIRMSPHLHYWIYGYSPGMGGFRQNMRGSGFRPMVFVGHGLPLAIAFSTMVISAFALYKNKIRVSLFSPFGVVCYLFLVLVLCKTMSALVYASLGLVLMHKYKPQTQVTIAKILVFSVLLYPLSRTMGIFPVTEFVEFLREISPERAQSMEYRLINEELLVERAMERPFFGWSGWGRSRIYDEYGVDLSTTDGKWILLLGNSGFMGMMAYYGILVLPILYASKAIKKIPDQLHKSYIAALTLILALIWLIRYQIIVWIRYNYFWLDAC